MTTIGDKIKAFEEIGKAPNCTSCGKELDNSDEGGAWISADYWDCDCESDYIHQKTEMACKVCWGREIEDGLPDSHVAEVALKVERPLCRDCQKLPSGLTSLVQAAGTTGEAERDMKAFLLAKLSEEDYAQAMRLVHRFRVLGLNLHEAILTVNHVQIPDELQIADPEKFYDLTIDRFVAVEDPTSGVVRNMDSSGEIERQRSAASDDQRDIFDHEPEDAEGDFFDHEPEDDSDDKFDHEPEDDSGR